MRAYIGLLSYANAEDDKARSVASGNWLAVRNIDNRAAISIEEGNDSAHHLSKPEIVACCFVSHA